VDTDLYNKLVDKAKDHARILGIGEKFAYGFLNAMWPTIEAHHSDTVEAATDPPYSDAGHSEQSDDTKGGVVRDVCCWTNCDNPAGGGTWTQIDVPQSGTEPMHATLPVCEQHWYGNWDTANRNIQVEIALLRQRLAQIAVLASDDSRSPL
jgi:hypothetical protein